MSIFLEMSGDLRYALRVIRSGPAVFVVGVISLALGSGANVAVFSALNSLLLKPLPVPAARELVFVQGQNFVSQSYPNYRDERTRATSLSGLAAYRIVTMGVATTDRTERMWGYLATANYFDVLGVQPALGRFFASRDGETPGASPHIVLSYGSWQRRFAGDPAIVGKTVRINGLPFTVLGVAPAGFYGTEIFYRPEIWAPMSMQQQIEGRYTLDNRQAFNIWVIGRVKPGVSRTSAEASLNIIAGELAREYPAANEALKFKLVKPGLIGDQFLSPVQNFMPAVMGLAALVLVAACANLTSSLSARMADRMPEFAIRFALGASHARVVRQLAIEILLLAVSGCGLGYAFAYGGLWWLHLWKAPLDLPFQLELTPNAAVFAFAVATCLLTGTLLGYAPLRQAWKADPNLALQRRAGVVMWGGLWFRDLMLCLQVAICCVLVTAALVSVRGLQRSLSISLGFRPARVSVLGIDASLAHFSQDHTQGLQKSALEAVARLPGVASASLASSIPLSVDQSGTSLFRENETDFRPSQHVSAYQYSVSPAFFDTVETRVLFGREFTEFDNPKSRPVAIINATLANTLTGTSNAVGRHFLYGPNGVPVEIIAVVEDGKYGSVTERPQNAVFRPAAQLFSPAMILLARARIETRQISKMREAAERVAPELPMYESGRLDDMLDTAFLPTRAATIALSTFGCLALMLAVTGIYGLAAYIATRRIREAGIRIAIGASGPQVLRSVLGRSGALLSLSCLVGLGAALATGRILAAIVPYTQANDPAVILSAVVTMLAAGIAAAWAPSRRVLSISPLEALRYE